jgi:HAD superfamily phosphoserine phosphatase-like hydrolase
MTTPIVVSDMDGTLATAETWKGVLAWIRDQYPSPAARRFVRARLHRIALARAGLMDKEAFRARWMEDQARLLRDLPEARLLQMADWVVGEHLWPTRRQAAIDAVTATVVAARRDHPGTRLVLATGAYQPLGEAFARRIGADVALGTPLELRAGVVTGSLAGPTASGEAKAAAVVVEAAGGEILAAFGDTVADIPLLRLATRAVAVAPDAALRREAAARGWELLGA